MGVCDIETGYVFEHQVTVYTFTIQGIVPIVQIYSKLGCSSSVKSLSNDNIYPVCKWMGIPDAPASATLSNLVYTL